MKPTVPDVLPLVHKLYERSPTGCCFHIVFDDGNCNRESVEFCRSAAYTNRCPGCVELGDKLLRMSVTQVKKLRALR